MRIFILLIIVSIEISCTKTIEIPPPEHESKLVVNCLFTPDSLFRLRLGKTISIFSSSPPPVIENAQIELFENDLPIDTLFFSGNEFLSHIIPVIGKKYHIEINTPEFQNISATDFVPENPQLLAATYGDSHFIDEEGDLVSQVNVVIRDNFETQDYYELLLIKKSIAPWNQDTLFVGVSFCETNDPVVVNEGLLSYFPETLVFSDRLFNGKEYPLKLDFFDDEDCFAYVVILRAISEEYYNYKKILTIHLENQESDIWYGTGEPVQMYTNIEGGYGIFAGYSEVVKTIDK